MRLFVAVDLGEQVRAELAKAIRQGSARAPKAKWVRPESIHVTLAFLGHQPDEKLRPLCQALDQVAARHRPLQVAAQDAGTFGTRARPRVLWVGLTGDSLQPLQKAVSDALVPWGYEPEKRAFQPHLTLARARDEHGDAALATAAAALAGVQCGHSRIDELILFESRLSPHGAQYTPLHRAQLSGG